uniref:PSP domain-containing protein n=1 Tax=Caenorhabditis tropicalis TaxID=1561998 RepID=A0A1I7UHM8_9PELO
MSDIEILEVITTKAANVKRQDKFIGKKRRRTSSGLIEKSETMKGTETVFEEFVIDRTTTPQRKLKVEDVQKSQDGSESASRWRQQLESTFLGSLANPQGAETPAKRPRKSCFNCDGEHNLRDCPKPKDFRRISKKKRESAGEIRRNHKSYETVGLSQQKQGQQSYKPGEISQKLRDALALGSNDIPEHIYRMRRLGFIKGYPPGWLRKAIKATDTIRVFSSESEEKDNETMKPPELDMSKIICYPGFNGDCSKYNDREKFKVPPINDFCTGYQEELNEIYKKQRKLDKRKLKSASKHKKFTNDDDDDDIMIIENEQKKNELDTFSTPGEDGVVVVLGTVNEEEAPATPIRKDVNMGQSMSALVGTPVFVQDLTPVAPLEAFAAGIQPFQAQQEEVENKGIFRKLMYSLDRMRNTNLEDQLSSIQEVTHDPVKQKFQSVPTESISKSMRKRKARNQRKKSQKSIVTL